MASVLPGSGLRRRADRPCDSVATRLELEVIGRVLEREDRSAAGWPQRSDGVAGGLGELPEAIVANRLRRRSDFDGSAPKRTGRPRRARTARFENGSVLRIRVAQVSPPSDGHSSVGSTSSFLFKVNTPARTSLVTSGNIYVSRNRAKDCLGRTASSSELVSLFLLEGSDPDLRDQIETPPSSSSDGYFMVT